MKTKTTKALENLNRSRAAFEAAEADYRSHNELASRNELAPQHNARHHKLLRLEADERRLLARDAMNLAEYEASLALEDEPADTGWHRGSFATTLRDLVDAEEDLARQLEDARARTADHIVRGRTAHAMLAAERAAAGLPAPLPLPESVALPEGGYAPIASAAGLLKELERPSRAPTPSADIAQIQHAARSLRIEIERATRQEEAEAKERETRKAHLEALRASEAKSLADAAEEARAKRATQAAEEEDLERSYIARQKKAQPLA